MHCTWDLNLLHNLYKGPRKLKLVLNVTFSGETIQKWCNISWVFCIDLIESKVLYNILKKFGDAPSDFGVNQIQTQVIVMFAHEYTAKISKSVPRTI